MARRQAKGDRRWARGFRALTLASVFTLPAAAQSPQGGTVMVGGAAIAGQGNQTLINQTTERALIDWRRFDIGSEASVLVTQPGAGSILVNRVTGDGIGTRIDGSLIANGQVVVIDKAGIVIGRDARIDAGAFLATTADIDNDDFAAGRLIFGTAGLAGAAVVNEGTIKVADGGYAVLAAPEVRNGGLVEARLGRVVLAGAERFTLDLAGDGLLRFELPADVAGRVVNDGTLTGPQVLITAQAARDGMAGVVNAGGLVEGVTARAVEGRIIIGGEGVETTVTGSIQAEGGAIDILGDRVGLTGATVDASGAGDGGQVRIGGDFQGGGDLHRSQTTRIDAASSIRADGATGHGGRIIVWSDGRTDYAGAISARGAQDGGFAEVSGKGVLRFAGTADLAGGAGGKAGQLLLDPTNITIGTVSDVDGTGPQDDDIPAGGSIGAGDYSGADSLITASAIAALLNNGTSVSLAASQDITVNSSIAKTSGLTSTMLKLEAQSGNLTFASGVGVTSSSGALSMDFDAGRTITATGGSFISNGGNIDLTATGGSGTTGITLSGASLSAGSGRITLNGTGTGTGVLLTGGTSLGATSGGFIELTGNGAVGIDFAYATASTSGNATISVDGTSNGTGAGSIGIRLDASSGGGISASSAAVTLTGSGGNGTGTANHGLLIMGGFGVSAGSGDVSVTATGGTGSVGILVSGSGTFGGGSQSGTVTLASDDMYLTGGTIQSSGRVHLRTRSGSANLIIGGSDDSAGLALSSTELATVTAGVLTLGHSAQTGTISVAANPGTTGIGALEVSGASLTVSSGNGLPGLAQTFLNAGKSVTLDSAGAMTVSDNISKSGGGNATLALRAGGDLTVDGSVAITSDGGDITLAGGDIILVSGSSVTTTGRVRVEPYATGGQMNVGATGAGSGVANVSQAELDRIDAGILRLGGLYGGNLVISDALSHDSQTVELASAGTVTQTAAINVTNLALLGTGGSYTLTNGSNSVTTLAGNTGSVDFKNDVTFSVGTVAGTTGLTFTGSSRLYAADALITLAQAATYTGSGTATFVLSSDINVAVAADIKATGTGSLNVVLGADGNVTGSRGYISIDGATLETKGGHILAGRIKADDAAVNVNAISYACTTAAGSNCSGGIGAALGGSTDGIGVNITGSTLNSGTGGNILVIGEGAATGTTSIGINVSNSVLQAAGSGTITLHGASGGGSTLSAGVAIGADSTIHTTNGAITIKGEQAGTGTGDYGVLFRQDSGHSTLYSTGSTIDIIATGTEGRIAANSSSSDYSKAYIGCAGISTCYGGAITLRADRLDLTDAGAGGDSSPSIRVGGTGTLVIRPDSASASIGVGSGVGDLVVSQGDIDAIWSGVASVTIGHVDDTGTVTASAAAFASNTIIQGGTGAITISGALSTGSGADAGSLSLETKGLLTIGAGISTQNQNITLTADRLDLTSTVNAGTATATLTTATAARTIDLGSGTDTAAALEISAAELNRVTAGTIRVGSSAAGAISVTQAITPTGSNSLHLRSGAGISQTGTISVTNLAVTAGGAVALATVNNDVTSFAASTSASNSNVAFRDDSGFAIATVDNVAGASLGTGTLTLVSTGTVTQSAAISAAGLAVTGTGATYTLAHAANAVSTLAANTGSIDIGLSGTATIGTAGSVTGITASGTVKLSSGGNLSIASGASVSAVGTGDAMVLAASGTFTNNGGENALSVSGGGRFLVFSTSPLTSSTGGIDALPYYNRGFTFTDRTYTALSNSGNRFVYSYAPTLTVTPDAVNRTYSGQTYSGSTYTVTGLVTGDSLSDAVSGTGTISGSGRNAGTYTLTAGLGTLASDLGYGFSFATGTLTVARKDLTYAVANGNFTYGTQATNGAVTLTGVVDGDSVAGAVTTYRGTDVETLAVRTDAGSLTQRVTALTGTDAANYQIAATGNTDGALTIGQKSLTYSVAAANSTYGTLATLGAATLTGIVDGDTVTATVGLSGATLEARLAAGSYDQTITLGGADYGNYSVAATGNSIGTLTVARKTLTYAIADADSIYGTLATLPTPSLTGVLMGDTVTTTAQVQGGTLSARLAAGDFTLVVGDLTGASAGNYVLAATGHTTGTLTVMPKTLTASIAAATSTYGQTATTGAVSFTGVLEGDSVGASVVVEGGGGTVTLSPTLDAGSYTQRVTGLTGTAAANYQLAAGSVTAALTVDKKTLTYAVADSRSTYGTLATNGAVTFTGIVNGDQLGGVVTSYRNGQEETLANRTAVGSLTQRVTALSGAKAANYQIASTGNSDGTLSIAQKSLTYTVNSVTSVYGTRATLGTATLQGVVEGDTVTATVGLSGAVLDARLAAGTYTQTVSVGGADIGNYSVNAAASTAGTLTIDRKPITYSIANVDTTYGTLAVPGMATLTGLVSGDDVTGAVTLKDGTLTARLPVGSHVLTLTQLGGAAAGNYVLAGSGNQDGVLSVAPKALTASIAAVTSTYGQTATTGAVTFDGLVAGDDVQAALEVQGAGGTVTLGPKLAAGTYRQLVTGLTGADARNYTLSAGQGGTASLTVIPAALTVTAVDVSKIYGTDDPALRYSVTGLVQGDALSGELTRAAGRDVGIYSINQGSLSAGANYTLSFHGGTLTINPAVLTVTAVDVSKIYGTDDPALRYSVTGLVQGDALSGELIRVAGRDVGTYSINQGSLSAGANYTLSFQGGTLTINPAVLNVTALSGSKIYGDADPALGFSVSGLVAGDSVSGALARAAEEDVGTYAISQGSLTAGKNYTISFQAGTLAITPAALTVTANAATRVYADQDPVFTYQVTGLKRGDSAAAVLSGELVRAAGEDVGTYAINQGGLAANANYTLSFTGADLTITPASLSLSVVAANAGKTYGDADPVFAYTASGVKGRDTLERVLAGSLSRVAGEDVGTYAITQGSLSVINPNYVIQFTPGTLTINPANLSVAAMMVTRTYGDGDPVLTYSVSGLKRGDNAAALLSGELARAAGEDVGTYAINQGSLALTNANYTLSFSGGQLTINPALLSVTANAVSRLYGAPDPALTYEVAGLKRGDAAGTVLSGTLVRAAGGTVGRYAIGQGTLAANANYRISFQGAELTINPAPLSVLVDSVTRAYGAANPVFTARYQGLVNGDTGDSLTGLRLQTAADASSAAGTYAITADGIANANYQITYVDGTLTVTGGGVLPPAVAEAAPVTTVTQPARAPVVPSVTVAAPVVTAPAAAPPAPAAISSPAATPSGDNGAAALAAVNQNVQSASGSAADDDSAAEEMIPGLLSQQRRLPGEAPEGTPGLEQQFPNLGRVW